MKNIGWFSNSQPSPAGLRRAACAMAIAILAAASGYATAQVAPAPETQIATPEGYSSHHSVDMGGRIASQVGAGEMYDTLVNLHSGMRVQGESYDMHALPGKNGFVDDLSAFGSGFGGDPNNLARLSMSKSKIFEFSGMFRRDRLYSDYNLLGNLNIAPGQSMANMVNGTPVAVAPWPQQQQSSVAFNTVRRMTDVNVTVLPFATFSYRFAYSHGTMEGPTFSPSYTPLGMKNPAILEEYQRNGNDDYLGAIDWKPARATKISLEIQASHYKSDSYFTLAPSLFLAQEANGTPVYLGFSSAMTSTPYGSGSTGTAVLGGVCNTPSMGAGYTSATNYTFLSPATTPGGLPVINAACDVMTGYLRKQNTRVWTPTETLRLQSAAIKNVVMNGNVHYTLGNSDMPNYYEASQGLNGAVRSAISSGGYSRAHRDVVGADYGIVWQFAPTISLADQVDFSSVKEPGYANIPVPVTLSTPTTAGNETINYSGTLTAGTGSLPHGNTGAWTMNFFGQEYLTNNLTLAWDASARARFSLTYHVGNRNIGRGNSTNPNHNSALNTSTDPYSGKVTINENGGILNAALHPVNNWDLTASVEMTYDDNVLTAISPRQTQVYRVHSIYRAKPWATISAGYSDRERHNNTENEPAGTTYNGPIAHVDYSRVGSLGVQLNPSERYGVDFNYSYSDVYSATNTCFFSGSTAATATTPAYPGAATVTSAGAPNLCSVAGDWHARDFQDAPTQFGSVAVSYAATDKVKADVGYTVSDVNGSRFFNDARDVNGMLVSTYQSPFVNLAYTMHPNLIWRAQYNYFGYGEGGVSGAQLCSTTSTATSTVVPCSTLPNTAMSGPAYGMTAPRNFHANNVTLGLHYEF